MRLALLAVAALCAAPAAAAPPAPLPATVRNDLAALHAECRGYGGRPGAARDLVKTADLNGDGLADHVVDLNAYNCEGAASAMGAGQSGAAIKVYAGLLGGGAKLAFQTTAYGAKISPVGGRSRLWIETTGIDCGQRSQGVPFSDQTFCSRPLAWNPNRAVFVFAPLSEAKPIQ